MDEDRLAAALRDATDDVEVPRDLVRGAERLGRARRARRRSVVTTLAVAAVVVAGGALVVPRVGAGGASSTAGAASSASSAADAPGSDAPGSDAPRSEASPEPSSDGPTSRSAPQSAQDESRDAQAPSLASGSAPCDPPLVVAGVPAREGYATSVLAGEQVEVTGSPLCGPLPAGTRYGLVLVARGSEEPTVLADVVPTGDGSFSTRVTVPSSTPPGPARLSVVGSTWVLRPCPDTADCTRPDYGAGLDVLPAQPGQPTAPSVEESP